MLYTLSLTDQPTSPQSLFMPRSLTTNVTEPGQAVITGIVINGENELMQEIDAYFFSSHALQKAINEFMTRHNLVGKTMTQIDRYCDDNDLSFPSNMRLDLPVLRKTDKISIEGMGSYQAALIGDV